MTDGSFPFSERKTAEGRSNQGKGGNGEKICTNAGRCETNSRSFGMLMQLFVLRAGIKYHMSARLQIELIAYVHTSGI